VNIDDVPRGFPEIIAYVGIFKDNIDEYVEDFSSYFGVKSSIYAEFIDVILLIEHDFKIDYRRLWPRSDSTLVCLVISFA